MQVVQAAIMGCTAGSQFAISVFKVAMVMCHTCKIVAECAVTPMADTALRWVKCRQQDSVTTQRPDKGYDHTPFDIASRASQ